MDVVTNGSEPDLAAATFRAFRSSIRWAPPVSLSPSFRLPLL